MLSPNYFETTIDQTQLSGQDILISNEKLEKNRIDLLRTTWNYTVSVPSIHDRSILSFDVVPSLHVVAHASHVWLRSGFNAMTERKANEVAVR